MRCIRPAEAEMIIEEVYSGSCALHSGYKTIASKVMRLDYFWPTLYRDVAKIVKRCKSCQRHAPQNRKSRHDMIPVNLPWPFHKWAINIVGPFPAGAGNVRFGIPHEIVSDIGAQISKDPFKSWCEELNSVQKFTSIVHPQANGLCEVTNRDIVSEIKKHLNEKRTGWVDELSNVLWAHRTTFKKSTGETPFSLVYGSEAIIPTEIFVPTHRIANFDENANDDALCENLNFVQERRLMAAIKEANNKQQIVKYYNKKVRALAFDVGEWVLCNNEANRAENVGKLGPNWAGPYQIIAINTIGSYKLGDIAGRIIPNAWHATLLKRYYAYIVSCAMIYTQRNSELLL
ncbi:uncharacterized protein [Rutidosis leptorrhynchoides]|uniref:uncharacterized protein n=1 Tax=Rutidosis leptorrhynchoides TaxID=125765 RepID=UPI003A99B655